MSPTQATATPTNNQGFLVSSTCNSARAMPAGTVTRVNRISEDLFEALT
ncbi:hypothetical protein ITP53_22945 [Nonomuraea sp. K274]|uniref:Uncharacterized protein n=1 Tax=Nonomuraea cypriaca TaxID=1187855 RepID=A0A931AED1_9ACTN|nr:hypothetical protein [Nonomuraea cypriaca]MBF8188530.1 hypothetical protein [Nonomuraea cypriaca]